MTDIYPGAPHAVKAKGWVPRRIVIYVNGTERGGPLAPFSYFLVFEDREGQKMYTLPEENKGALLPRLLKPNSQGVIRIAPTSVHPSRGALVINAWPPPESTLPDLQGRCSYVGCTCGTLEFRVDYAFTTGQETSETSSGTSEGSPSETYTTGGSDSSEAGGEFEGLGGKSNTSSSFSTSRTSASYGWTTGRGSSSTRPVVYVRSISIRSINSPPDM